jgi:hypothetical protein
VDDGSVDGAGLPGLGWDGGGGGGWGGGDGGVAGAPGGVVGEGCGGEVAEGAVGDGGGAAGHGVDSGAEDGGGEGWGVTDGVVAPVACRGGHGGGWAGGERASGDWRVGGGGDWSLGARARLGGGGADGGGADGGADSGSGLCASLGLAGNQEVLDLSQVSNAVLVLVVASRDGVPDHEPAKVIVAVVLVDQRLKLIRRQVVVNRTGWVQRSQNTNGKFGVLALGARGLEALQPRIVGEAAVGVQLGDSSLDTSLRVVRVQFNPVSSSATVGVVELNPDDVELGALDHQVHVRIVDNALRSTGDEVVAALREVATEPVDHGDISNGIV